MTEVTEHRLARELERADREVSCRHLKGGPLARMPALRAGRHSEGRWNVESLGAEREVRPRRATRGDRAAIRVEGNTAF